MRIGLIDVDGHHFPNLAPKTIKDLQRWCNAKWIIGACPDFNKYKPRKEIP